MKSLMISALAATLILSCSGNDEAEHSNADSVRVSKEPGKIQRLTEETDQAAGIRWNLPIGWRREKANDMRVATYSIAPVRTDTVGAECGSFFFGSGQGGDVEANIERWLSQVVQPDGSPTRARMKRKLLEIDCCMITIVEIPGTYRPSGMGGQGVIEHEGWVIVGAIVEAPEGNVFFKVTGPELTVYAHRGQFGGMLRSIREVGL